jgi:hypothetical protein
MPMTMERERAGKVGRGLLCISAALPVNAQAGAKSRHFFITFFRNRWA